MWQRENALITLPTRTIARKLGLSTFVVGSVVDGLGHLRPTLSHTPPKSSQGSKNRCYWIKPLGSDPSFDESWF